MDALAFAIFALEEHFKDPREVVGHNLTELFEYLHPVGEGRKQVERFGRVHGLERQFITLLGQRKWVLVDLWHIEGENGAPPLIEAVVRDITRLKLAEESLREQEERWQQLFQQADVPKLIIDGESGAIVDANAAAEAFYGWPRTTLRTRTAGSLALETQGDGQPSKDSPPFLEQHHQRADGSTCAVVVHATPYPWHERDLILWTIRDDSSRGYDRKVWANTEQRFRRIVEADTAYIYRVTVEEGAAVTTEHEPGCQAVTGYPSEAYRENPYLWYAMVYEDDRDAVVEQARRVLAGEGFDAIEHRIVRSDGVVRWVRSTVVPEFDDAGCLVAYDGLIRDITSRNEAEEAMRRSESRFRVAFETGYQAMFVLSGDLRIIECNEAACVFHGLSREELIAAPISRRMPTSAEAQMLGVFEIASRTGTWAGESQRFGPEGDLREVEVAVTRYFVDGTMHFFVSVHDITERKHLEAQLASVKDTLDLTLDAVMMVDPDTLRFIYANRGASELLGLDHDAICERTPLDFHPDTTQANLHAALDSLREQRTASMKAETRILRADGQLVPVEIFLQYIQPAGAPPRVVAILRDITERRKVETALRENEEELVRAQRIAHLGSWSHPLGAESVLLSNEARSVLSWEPNTIDGIFPDCVAPLCHEHDWPELRESLEACLSHGRSFEHEVRVVRPHGAGRHVLWTGVARHDDAGVLTEVHGTVQDITERKRAEEERLKLEAKMRHAQKLESLGVLAGGIAHDFNNILTAILGNAGLLMEDLPEDGVFRRRLGEIERAARRAADLAQQMLAYSGRGMFIIRLVELNDLLHETAVLLNASISKKVNLRIEYADALPPVQADAVQMSQVIMNLVANAAEAIGDEDGVITVRTSTMVIVDSGPVQTVDDDPIEPGTYVCLEVIDTGCGMSEDVKSRLFDPFFTTKFTGRGLGLAAVIGIVRAHRGALQVESKPGEGAHFRVLLPMASGQVAKPTDVLPAVEGFRGQGTVLLVDDEPAIRTVGKRMLERLGFTVLTAEDGVGGVALFKEHADDIVCVILDLVMPRMDGAEALQEIYRIQPGAKIVLCSGYSREEISQRFADQGISGFLHKPFQMHQLAAALQGALAK